MSAGISPSIAAKFLRALPKDSIAVTPPDKLSALAPNAVIAASICMEFIFASPPPNHPNTPLIAPPTAPTIAPAASIVLKARRAAPSRPIPIAAAANPTPTSGPAIPISKNLSNIFTVPSITIAITLPNASMAGVARFNPAPKASTARPRPIRRAVPIPINKFCGGIPMIPAAIPSATIAAPIFAIVSQPIFSNIPTPNPSTTRDAPKTAIASAPIII